MLCKINLTSGKGGVNLDILENAFSQAPSFAIFEMYHQSSNSNASDTYQKLDSLVDSRKYRDVFFAIAAYLDLQDEIKALRISTAEIA